ncbi:unnamed protein product, partial [marine sediment metagenome]
TFTLINYPTTRGNLYITSSPTGASVSIHRGTAYLGTHTTPISYTNMISTQYKLIASKSGYESQTKYANVYAGQTTNVHFTLVPIELPPAEFHFEYLSKTEQAKPGEHVEAKVRIWNDSAFAIEVQSYI